MRFFFPPQLGTMVGPTGALGRWTIGKFLAILGAGALTCLLALAFVIIYRSTAASLSEAFARNAQLRAKAQASAASELLGDAARELEYLGQGSLNAEELLAHFNAMTPGERNRFAEVAFQGTAKDDYFVLVNTGTVFVPVPQAQVQGESAGVLAHIGDHDPAQNRGIRVGEPTEASYVALPVQDGVRSLFMHVIRLAMPVFSGEQFRGHLVLSVDLLRLRNMLSLHTSEHSPLFLPPQDGEHKKSFCFDLAGWVLFESAQVDAPDRPLAVDKLRIGIQGDVGRPGFQVAFRPASDNHRFWAMVTQVRAGQSGRILTSDFFADPGHRRPTLFLSYAPIVFHGIEGDKVVGGIGCFDSSSTLTRITWEIFRLLAGILLVCFLILSCVLFLLGRRVGAALERMAMEIDKKIQAGDSSPLEYFSPYAELNRFQKSINILLLQLYMARRDILQRDTNDADERRRQPVNLDKIIKETPTLDQSLAAAPLDHLVGAGPAIAELRQRIQGAASVLADVLVIGETGTGKEVTAGAVHSLSFRSKGPFISISCGALDENLLMDALFGHVQGAFSDAHSDRKGAFLAASGGTLLLDEIGNASLKVQQALLRALSVRRIVPLGSDQEIPFDARIIAATNVDLLQAAAGPEPGFRDDLYYRLAVITINTPALRHHKEDLPVLIRHFLTKICAQRNRPLIGVSQGALDKLTEYDWPGNVRELEHCLIRAMAFVDGDVLLDEHIRFNEAVLEKQEGTAMPPVQEESGRTMERGLDEAPVLNERQQAVWPLILRQGSISRSEYQEALEERISVRTAQYDLYDLVDRGFLVKSGRGPSSRYTLVEGQVMNGK